jgi:hypothetical protein
MTGHARQGTALDKEKRRSQKINKVIPITSYSFGRLTRVGSR